MKLGLTIFLLVLTPSFIFGQGIVYQEGTIDLTGKIDLKMVFDGGLRPTLTPGLEDGSCQVENIRANIVFPGNRVVQVLVETGVFHVAADQTLTSIDFYGPYQPLQEAVQRAEAICQILSLNPGNLENILLNPGSINHPNASGWGQEVVTDQYRAQFILRPRYRFKETGADQLFAYRWRYGNKPPTMSTTPIHPPQGYEGISMKPPELHPTGPPYPPLTLEEARAVGQKAFEKLEEEEKVQSPAPTTPPVLKPAPPATETGIPGWIYGLIVLSIVVVVGAGYYLWSRKKNGP